VSDELKQTQTTKMTVTQEREALFNSEPN